MKISTLAKTLLFATFIFVPTFVIGQKADKREVPPSMIKLKKPFATFDSAKGLTNCSTTPEWIALDNEIDGLDNFQKLELGIAECEGKEYLYLKKDWSWMQEKKLTNMKNIEVYGTNSTALIFDINEYKAQVDSLNATDNLITLSVLDYCPELTNSQFEPIIMSENPYFVEKRQAAKEELHKRYEKKLKKAIADKDSIQEEYCKQIIKSLDIPFKDANRLIIKLKLDEKKKYARFLIFTANQDQHIYESLFNVFNVKDYANFEITPEIQHIIWSDRLFDSFYYESSYKSFLKFIQSPLKKIK